MNPLRTPLIAAAGSAAPAIGDLMTLFDFCGEDCRGHGQTHD